MSFAIIEKQTNAIVAPRTKIFIQKNGLDCSSYELEELQDLVQVAINFLYKKGSGIAGK